MQFLTPPALRAIACSALCFSGLILSGEYVSAADDAVPLRRPAVERYSGPQTACRDRPQHPRLPKASSSSTCPETSRTIFRASTGFI